MSFVFNMVRVKGLEPPRQGRQNLNLVRLPFRHTRNLRGVLATLLARR